MNILPKNLWNNNIPAKEKIRASHRNRGLPVYTFYHYWAKNLRRQTTN
jgi:hypothetical protein